MDKKIKCIEKVRCMRWKKCKTSGCIHKKIHTPKVDSLGRDCAQIDICYAEDVVVKCKQWKETK